MRYILLVAIIALTSCGKNTKKCWVCKTDTAYYERYGNGDYVVKTGTREICGKTEDEIRIIEKHDTYGFVEDSISKQAWTKCGKK